MSKLGYRKIERYVPTKGQWLREQGLEDANTELYFLRNIGPDAQYRRRSNSAEMRRVRKKEKRLMREQERQSLLYQEAIDAGHVKKVVEYVPLDMSREADVAYLQVQKKRAARRKAREGCES